MFRCFRLLVLQLMLTCAVTGLAVGQDQRIARPQPSPELRQLGFFVGTFRCKGEAFKTPMSEPHPVERTIAGKMDLDGFWLFMRFDDMASATNPMPIRGNWQLAHNARERNFVALWTDNLGRWFPQTSAGWEGDSIAFTGEFTLNDQKGVVRDSFTRKSEREMIMTVDIPHDGDWMPLLKFDCVRS
jgi:Protein of unknown function (DUF1579)